MKKIIYRLSDHSDYAYGENSWLQVRDELDNNEHYLFKEVWKLNEYAIDNPYGKKVEENFVKIVNTDWIKKHTTAPNYIEFYGCRVLKDYEPYNDYENCVPTQYDKEINNL